MVYVRTWDILNPELTDLVKDGAAEIRQGVKEALNERLLTVFVDLTSDPLVHSKVLLQATGRVNLDGLAAGDTYIYEVGANSISYVAGGVRGLFTIPTGSGVDATLKLWPDGGGDTYLIESSANVLKIFAGGVENCNLQATFATFNLNVNLQPTKRFSPDGGGDTYLAESSANVLSFIIGGAGIFDLHTTYLDLTVDVVIAATKKLRLDGSSVGDTYIAEAAANQLVITVGGQAAFTSNSGSAQLGASTAHNIGFYNAAGTTQQTPTGSRAGNAALASLLTKLALTGLIVDGTSA